MDFWEVYDQHYASVRQLILASVKDEWVADDLLQETFLRVQANLDSLRDPSKVPSWIFSIAHNLCRDHFRKAPKSSDHECVDRDDIEIIKPSAKQQDLEQRQMEQCVQNLTNLIPEAERTVIHFFDIMDLSHQEVARILGITVESAKVRLHRAGKTLRPIFETDNRNILTCEPVETAKPSTF
jgi:RNA polymerase sigma-70 factor (ECF subfamily)